MTEINYTVPTKGHVIPKEEMVSNVLCFAALANKNKGAIYTDVTSALPFRSINVNTYDCLVYN